MTDINWDDVLNGEGAEDLPLPKETYPIQVKKAEAKVASTGSPMINLQCEVTTGPHKGRMLFTNIVLKTDSPGAMKFALKKLKALGISREWLLSSGAQAEQIAAQLTGKTALAKVGQKEYQGEMRNEIDTFIPSTGGDLGTGVPAPPSAPAASAPPVPEPPTAAAPSTTPDDEPF